MRHFKKQTGLQPPKNAAQLKTAPSGQLETGQSVLNCAVSAPNTGPSTVPVAKCVLPRQSLTPRRHAQKAPVKCGRSDSGAHALKRAAKE